MILLFVACNLVHAQQTIHDAITHNGIQRSFILYIPTSYSPEIAAPLVFNFHGYTSNAQAQMAYGDFREIADTAGFLLVHPQGILDGNGATHWNAEWGTGVDDIGFTDALIDSLAANYQIDLSRVYSTGMSNGGYMSYTLACRLSHRMAAVASVTGSMTVWQLNNPNGCDPQRPVPVMQFHGTSDGVVPYNGSNWSGAIDNVLQYWVDVNNCDTQAEIYPVANIFLLDGSTAEHHVFRNGDNGVEVEFYKIFNGGHTWPGTRFPNGITNYDINASEKIWQFFSQYDINGRIVLTETDRLNNHPSEVSVYPNPARDILRITSSETLGSRLKLITLLGLEVINQKIDQRNASSISVQHLKAGIYFLKVMDIQDEVSSIHKVFIK